jgi:aminoglycoside 3-N-acetyltransferase
MSPAKLRAALSRMLGERLKRTVKTRMNEAKKRLVSLLLGYDGAQLKARLRAAGISESDTILVHSNFKPDSGFRGAPLDVVNALVELVGEKGNLLMVSIPFRGAAYDYLAQGKEFNVRKTLSMMGLITEMFRRRNGTLRSLHPTHPVLAHGKDAQWLVADHERCFYPCGPGSPFEKFRQLQGKLLFFDVSFRSITFFHYVEDILKDRLPFPVYSDHLFSVPAVDARGEKRVVQTYAFNNGVRRMAEKLEVEMEKQGSIRHGRVGNSRFRLATAEDVVACFTAMVRAGNLPYELETSASATPMERKDDE